MNIGLTLVSITVFIVISFFIAYKWTKKVFDNYWFYLAFGIIGLIYFIFGRWALDIKNLANNGWIVSVTNNPLFKDGEQLNQEGSILVSKALLLDLCPFVTLLLSIAFICDVKKRFVKILAPWAIFGGTITLFGGILFEDVKNVGIWEYIFIGMGNNPNNRLYFIMHFYLFTFGIIALTSCKRYSINDFLYTCLLIGTYLIYVKIVVSATGCSWNATGMVENDWTYGEYHVVGSILNLPFPQIQFVSYFAVFIAICMIISLKSLLCFDLKKRINIFNNSWFIIFPFLYTWIIRFSFYTNLFVIKSKNFISNKKTISQKEWEKIF